MGLGLIGVLQNALLGQRDPELAADLILRQAADASLNLVPGYTTEPEMATLLALMRRIRDEPTSGLRSR